MAVAALAVVGTVALVACSRGSGSGLEAPGRPGSSAPATAPTTVSTTTLTASLSGAAEVPGPGAEGALGTVRVTLDPGAGQLCFDLAVAGVDAPTAAHVHTGPRGVLGPVSVTLAPPGPAGISGCVAAAPELVASMVANPAGFYVDVHDDAHPAGAARGQLSR
jgi:hypothetical protein